MKDTIVTPRRTGASNRCERRTTIPNPITDRDGALFSGWGVRFS